MNEREEQIRIDVHIFHILNNATATMYGSLIPTFVENKGLAVAKRQAEILASLYDGVSKLAIRSGCWEDALMVTRNEAYSGSEARDTDIAYRQFLTQTDYLFPA